MQKETAQRHAAHVNAAATARGRVTGGTTPTLMRSLAVAAVRRFLGVLPGTCVTRDTYGAKPLKSAFSRPSSVT